MWLNYLRLCWTWPWLVLAAQAYPAEKILHLCDEDDEETLPLIQSGLLPLRHQERPYLRPASEQEEPEQDF